MKLFHGWKMVGAGFGLQVMQAGLLHQSFGAYVAVLHEERGWSKTSLSAAASLQSTETALIGPLLGWLIDRFGPEIIIRIGVVAFGLGLIALSQIDSLPGLYGAVVLIAVGVSCCGYHPVNVAVIHWFERYRGRAMSGTGFGYAIGGLFVPVVALCIQAFGWRYTAAGSGVLAIVVGWQLARFFRGPPEKFGMTVDGLPAQPAQPAPSSAGAQTPSQPVDPRDFSLGEALRTRAFWLVSLGHGSALFVVASVNVHAISHMRASLGYSVSEASLVITLMVFGQIAGGVLGWAFNDKLEKRLIAAFCMILHAVGMLCLTFANGVAMLVAFAAMHGIAWGWRGPMMQAMRADYFGRRAIGMIIGVSAIVTAIGQIGGPLIAGALFDVTGTYHFGFSVLAGLSATGAVLFILARRPHRDAPA